MDQSDIPRLVYLIVLCLAVAGWFIAENRQSLGKTARQALVWGLIFLGVIAGFGLWEDIRRDIAPRQAIMGDGARIEVPRAGDGHYHLVVGVNGTPVEFLVDTGASSVVLSDRDARRVGIDVENLAFTGFANTANGVVRTAQVRVDDVSLGGVSLRNFPVSVNGGQMGFSLLGMDYLETFERIEISGGQLVLER
ncbi:MAG: TIGR02281 family clan AA aspartic protease [Pseudomonadota bacterium]